MSKNKLLIAITAGLFTATAATGAFAQTSSGNSSAGGDTSATTQGDMSGSATTKHKKPRKHSAHPSAGKKTPDASTGNNAAGEGGQSK
ncbi:MULTISPECIES: hypothetical protein [Caballeronia]|uniref:hypothetical protein n=1 Tax=Caballeronia TaxID=1827195 RepID=UPI00045EFB7D|nr:MULTISPECIES: hypothetical protein [unclassified Caballeronia]AQG99517.1 hypothetical protein A9R05_12300 [Burkholderia sp. KK1]MCE4540848.1 hypothetical protein [Caballeronia sp. PC1]MCE4570109.1 hypothetical protein [Caballeronia sp. CLC5]BAO87269.1 uncharacterized protein BRPE67_ACDS22140 [Burkholderia sp. RPE67]